MRYKTIAFFCCCCKLVFNYTSPTLIIWSFLAKKRPSGGKLGARISEIEAVLRRNFSLLQWMNMKWMQFFSCHWPILDPLLAKKKKKKSLGNFICHNMIFSGRISEKKWNKTTKKSKFKYRVHELLFTWCRNRDQQNKWVYIGAMTSSIQPTGQWGEKVTQAKLAWP